MGDKQEKHPYLKRSTTNIPPKLNPAKTKSIPSKTIQSTNTLNTRKNTTNSQTNINSNQTKQDTTKTFAETTASSFFPKKDQAIIFNTIEGTPQIEYIKALSTLTNPANILFASRISNNRFCVYLANKNIVNDIIIHNPTISVNNHTIHIRKLINQSKRIILSNVSPIIPHSYISDALINIGINTLAPITFVKAGFSTEALSHIISFRRQTYIKHDDISKLPGSILINYEDEEYRIFITDDTLTCYLCKRSGHTTAHCKTAAMPNLNQHNNKQFSNPPKITESNTHSSNTSFPPIENNIKSSLSPSPTGTSYNVLNNDDTQVDWNNESEQQIIEPSTKLLESNESPTDLYMVNENLTISLSDNNFTDNSNTIEHNIKLGISQTKRPISDTASQKSLETLLIGPTKQPESKKPKICSRSNSITITDDEKIDEALKPAEAFFSSSENISLPFNKFKYIVENFTNKSVNIRSLCDELKTDALVVMSIIEKIHPSIKNRSMKIKLTKLSNLLFQIMPTD